MRRALLALLLVLPAAAAAEDPYAHRFVVEGRLIGGNDLPLAGALVTVEPQGDSFESPCDEPSRATTDAFGDFWICYHKHELKGGALLAVRAGNASSTRFVDTELRRMAFLLRDPEREGAAPAGWSDSFRVSGRAWLRSPTEIEGVQVEGAALTGEHVTVAVGLGGSWTSYPRVTNESGDFDALVRVPSLTGVESLDVDATAQGQTAHGAVSTAFHRAFVDVRLPVEEASREAAPGTKAPAVSPALALGVLGSIALAAWYQRKKG